MNAVVLAYGLSQGTSDGERRATARRCLAEFWHAISDTARWSLLKPSPVDQALSPGNMDFSPFYQWFEGLTRMASPYQLNPLNINPLKDVLLETVDFDALHRSCPIQLFVCATNVKTGRIRIFRYNEVSADAVMASACLPQLFQAVEVDGEFYWDGGFIGNPPIYPLIYNTQTADVLIVQINPINIPDVPVTAQDIADRVNTLSFNSSLMREMRSINFVTKLLDEHRVDPAYYKKLLIHSIDAEQTMAELGVSSKLNADRNFLYFLFELGQHKAKEFLGRHYDQIGRESSTNIIEKFL